MDKLDHLNPQKESTKKRNIKVYDTASQLYNDFLVSYYHKYYELSDDKRKKLSPNMILHIYLLMDMIIVCSQKNKETTD